jgi:hypothetical protein
MREATWGAPRAPGRAGASAGWQAGRPVPPQAIRFSLWLPWAGLVGGILTGALWSSFFYMWVVLPRTLSR